MHIELYSICQFGIELSESNVSWMNKFNSSDRKFFVRQTELVYMYACGGGCSDKLNKNRT